MKKKKVGAISGGGVKPAPRTRKKVGAVSGGGVKPAPRTRKKVGAVKRAVRETTDCGCTVEYPDNYNGIGTGRPVTKDACKSHAVMAVRKKVGRIVGEQTKGTRIGHRQCEHCQGLHVDGNWCHDANCEHVAVLWDFAPGVWRCQYGCTPTQLPTALAHVWDCQFWDEYNTATPF